MIWKDVARDAVHDMACVMARCVLYTMVCHVIQHRMTCHDKVRYGTVRRDTARNGMM